MITIVQIFSKGGPWADPEGGDRGSGPPPPWNCQIINFCHVEIFRQTPSGNLDPTTPPSLRKFSGSAHGNNTFILHIRLQTTNGVYQNNICSFINHLENAKACPRLQDECFCLRWVSVIIILYKIIRSDMGVADEYPRSLLHAFSLLTCQLRLIKIKFSRRESCKESC